MKSYFERFYADSKEEFCHLLATKLKKQEKMFVVTANPETFMVGLKDPEMKTLLDDSTTVLIPDGVGVVKGALMLDVKVKERIPGVEIATYLLEEANRQEYGVYLLGASKEVLTKMIALMEEKYPHAKLLGATDGYVQNKDEIMDKMSSLHPDIVLVALGMGTQEKLIYRHLKKFSKGIFVGVGGSFDVISGSKKRAPKVFQKLNLEWFYRIAKEPKRLKRFYDNNVKFIQVIGQEKKPNKLRFYDLWFLIILGFILVGGMVKPILKPVELNLYENRMANQLPPFSWDDFSKTTYQNKLELALADQIPLSYQLKRVYNLYDNVLLMGVTNLLYAHREMSYVPLRNGVSRFGPEHHLVSSPYVFSDLKDKLVANINSYNSLIKNYPDLDFYAYYIEKETDIDLEKGNKVGIYDFVKSNLKVKDGQIARYQVDNLSDLDQYFYRTDHHWNHVGSYRGYEQVMKLLNSEEQPLKPTGTSCLPYSFSGSRANLMGARYLYNEPFCVYDFQLPEHTTLIDGAVKSYGNHDLSSYQSRSEVSYATYYGTDHKELSFDYQQPEKPNLLMFGESYDNAINELVASHYNKTYNIDLRYWAKGSFDFDAFVKDHDIDVVLFIGNADFYQMDTFQIGGE